MPELPLPSVRAALPSNLPKDIKEEVFQEIILAIWQRELTVDDLDTKTVREFIRGVYKSYSNPYSHISLDHMIGESLRLGDVLEG